MEENEKDNSYSHILKYTGIFGGVQGLGILVGIVRNKLTTLLIGASGLGLLSLFNSTVNMLVSACNFGIPTSGVQEMSGIYQNTPSQLDESIKMIRSWSLLTALLGLVLCVIIGPLLNDWSFSWGDYTLHFVFLSPAVAFTIVAGGELAVLKATRQLRALATSSFYVIIASLLFSVPIYYFFRQAGIVMVLLVSAFVQMASAVYFASRHYPYFVSFSPAFLKRGLQVIKLGVAFVIAGLLGSGSEFFVRTYINKVGDLEHVGFFNAGWTLTVVYAGLVFTAMEADYFPRLSSIKEKGKKQNECVNRQIEINVLLVGPILTVMLFMLPLLIPMLYDQSFLAMLRLAQFAVVSVLFRAIYLPIEYLPLSKGLSKVYLCQEASAVVLLVLLEIAGYANMGLTGIGIGVLLAYSIEVLGVLVYSYFYYAYVVSKKTVCFIGIQLFFVGVSLALALFVVSPLLYWLSAAICSSLAVICTLYLFKKQTDVFALLQSKLRK